jgi:ankyrin repeat protein
MHFLRRLRSKPPTGSADPPVPPTVAQPKYHLVKLSGGPTKYLPPLCIEWKEELAIDEQYWDPIHEAAYGNDCLLVHKLIIHDGVDKNALDRDGQTPLHVAAKWGSALHMLIDDHKVDVNILNKHGETPLHRAARAGDRLSCHRLLSRHHADIDALDARENTPLHVACEGGYFEAIKYLLIALANPLAKNVDGETFLDVARRCGLTEVLVYWKEMCPEA